MTQTGKIRTIIFLKILVFIFSCSSQKPSGSFTSALSREEAVRMIQDFAGSYSLKTSGLNEKNFGGIEINLDRIFFEYLPDQKILKSSVLIYKFHQPPKPGLIEAFQNEEKAGTDTGGGTVEYQPENQGLFLTRMDKNYTNHSQFSKNIEKLMNAGKYWSNEVLDRVASKFFHPEELNK